MIKRLAKLSATAQYTFGKMAPFSSGITLATVVSMYTGLPWAYALGTLITVFGIAIAIVHYTGFYKAEQHYVIGELGGADKGVD